MHRAWAWDPSRKRQSGGARPAESESDVAGLALGGFVLIGEFNGGDLTKNHFFDFRNPI